MVRGIGFAITHVLRPQNIATGSLCRGAKEHQTKLPSFLNLLADIKREFGEEMFARRERGLPIDGVACASLVLLAIHRYVFYRNIYLGKLAPLSKNLLTQKYDRNDGAHGWVPSTDKTPLVGGGK